MRIFPLAVKVATFRPSIVDATGPLPLTSVDLAFLAAGRPNKDTVWSPYSVSGGEVALVLAGPEVVSPPADAVVIPAGGADLWIRLQDNPEVDVIKVERIVVG